MLASSMGNQSTSGLVGVSKNSEGDFQTMRTALRPNSAPPAPVPAVFLRYLLGAFWFLGLLCLAFWGVCSFLWFLVCLVVGFHISPTKSEACSRVSEDSLAKEHGGLVRVDWIPPKVDDLRVVSQGSVRDTF